MNTTTPDNNTIMEPFLDRMRIFQEMGSNPLLALANLPNQDALFDEVMKQPTIFAELFASHIDTKKGWSKLDHSGQSPLHYCFASAHIMKTLIEKYHISVDIQNISGETPLMKAAEYGYLAPARYLLDAGAKWNMVDNIGQNLLHKISREFKERDMNGQLGVITALQNISNALPILLAQQDQEGKTPLDYARDGLQKQGQDNPLSRLIEILEKNVEKTHGTVEKTHGNFIKQFIQSFYLNKTSDISNKERM